MLRRLIDRLRLPFRKDRELRSALFRILGFYPHHIEYYKIAFAHKSQALRDKNGKPLNNERLEFLGDAILESVVSDILYHHFEKRHEGFLTATRSKIVQRESLNRLAKEMGIDKLIQTSTRNHSAHSHLGGNAFEALMGAIYLDKGYKACQKFVQKQILGRLMDLDGVANKEVNFKSKLLEWCQKNKLKQDFVMRLEDNGKQKEPTFYCTVIIEAIEKAGYKPGDDVKIALDVAASEFYDADADIYNLTGEGVSRKAAEMVEYYEMLCDKYPIISIEDGLAEDDWEGWNWDGDRTNDTSEAVVVKLNTEDAAEQFLEILALFGIDKDVYGLLDYILGIASSVFIWISAILCIVSGVIYIIDNKEFISQTK